MQQELLLDGLVTVTGWGGQRDPYQDQGHVREEIISEVAWADDLALLAEADSPEEMIQTTRRIGTVMVNACLEMGLEPNFSKGKTEAILVLKGKNSATWRRQIGRAHV